MDSPSPPVFHIAKARGKNFESRRIAVLKFTTSADLETRNTVRSFCETRALTLDESPSNEGGKGGGNGLWKKLAGVGLVVGCLVGLSGVYKAGLAIESTGRAVVGAVNEWKQAGFPSLVNIEKVGDKFSIF